MDKISKPGGTKHRNYQICIKGTYQNDKAFVAGTRVRKASKKFDFSMQGVKCVILLSLCRRSWRCKRHRFELGALSDVWVVFTKIIVSTIK
jgi:hypothetical protein